MRPKQERKGSGLREIGDGLLIVGERGVVVQAKSRDTEPGDPDREARWIDKKILGAVRQADGTVRQLCRKASEMTNGRGRAVVVDGNTISWVTVVIVDHPTPPTGHPIPKIDSRIPAVVLVRRDWEFLGVEFVDAAKRSGDTVLATAGSAWIRFDQVSFGAAGVCLREVTFLTE